MRAAVYKGNRQFAVEDVGEFSALGPGEVLLKVRYCGVCGSDLTHLIDRLAGASTVIVSEPSTKRAELARALGADVVINPLETDLVAPMKAHLPGGADVGFECSGARGVLQKLAESVRRTGEVVQIGAT